MNQITIVTGNRTGLIAEISRLLSGHQINIDSFNGRVVGTDAVLRLQVSDLQSALAVLTQAGFRVISEDVVVFQVEDVPGALAKISQQLADEQLDIRMMQTINRSGGFGIVAIASDNNVRARELLADRLLA